MDTLPQHVNCGDRFLLKIRIDGTDRFRRMDIPLNIVIKLQTVNGRAVAKLSDTPGKAMCRDEDYLKYLKRSVAFRLEREKNVGVN